MPAAFVHATNIAIACSVDAVCACMCAVVCMQLVQLPHAVCVVLCMQLTAAPCTCLLHPHPQLQQPHHGAQHQDVQQQDQQPQQQQAPALPYRMVLAVATMDSVMLYETEVSLEARSQGPN